MLALREFKKTHGDLRIYDVLHGSFDVGRLEPWHVSDGWKKKLDGWCWRMTSFSGVPQGIACFGRTADRDAALQALADEWQQFIERSEMSTGNLRLRPQPDHDEGLADNHIYAGEFRFGRIYQKRALHSVDWVWLITGFYGYTPCNAIDREHAMADIKAAWRHVYERTQS